MKHMKKSMFITTVMMVVLLIVAVSTATFAWYTSSNTVNTVATQVNSAEASGANIAIGWADNTPVGTASMTFYSNETDFQPMVPVPASAGTLLSDSPFYTANLSFGELPSPATATPYVGAKEASGATTFYVINYSQRASNITFSANVSGENAARLRVAVFNAASKACVYTNADCYYGVLVDPTNAVFTAITEQPADWATNYASYSSNNASFVAVAGVAPTWRANTYYTGAGVLTLEEPANWAGNYADYSTTASPFTAVNPVAPAFVASSFYTYAEAQPQKLSAPAAQKISAISTATLIALSDGVNGTAQGFIVKAWFDGPTQIDAFGGKDATFTLTATAAVVA